MANFHVKLADPSRVYRHPAGAFTLRGTAVADAGAEDSPGYGDVRAKISGGMLVVTDEEVHDNTIPRNAAIPSLQPPIVPIWRATGATVRTGPDAGAAATDQAADQGIPDEAGQVPPPMAEHPPVAVATANPLAPAQATATIQQVNLQGAAGTNQASGDGSADTDNAGNPVDPAEGADNGSGAAGPEEQPAARRRTAASKPQ